LNAKVKGQGHQGQKPKTAESCPLTCAVGLRRYAASSNRRYHCVANREWRQCTL